MGTFLVFAGIVACALAIGYFVRGEAGSKGARRIFSPGSEFGSGGENAPGPFTAFAHRNPPHHRKAPVAENLPGPDPDDPVACALAEIPSKPRVQQGQPAESGVAADDSSAQPRPGADGRACSRRGRCRATRKREDAKPAQPVEAGITGFVDETLHHSLIAWSGPGQPVHGSDGASGWVLAQVPRELVTRYDLKKARPAGVLASRIDVGAPLPPACTASGYRWVRHPNRPALYTIEDLTKTYGKGASAVEALRHVSLEIGGGVTAITGPNGSGKSTLLCILGALDVPTSGKVWYRGEPMPFHSPRKMNEFRARIPAFVLQDLNLFQDQSAVENVAFSLTRYGEPYGKAIQAAYEQLEAIGIGRKEARRRPQHLSGGQKQRVAIARALLAHRRGGAEVILADEPTASVDSTDAVHVFGTLLELAHRQQVPVIVVTHNPALAHLADRVLICEHGTIREG